MGSAAIATVLHSVSKTAKNHRISFLRIAGGKGRAAGLADGMQFHHLGAGAVGNEQVELPFGMAANLRDGLLPPRMQLRLQPGVVPPLRKNRVHSGNTIGTMS